MDDIKTKHLQPRWMGPLDDQKQLMAEPPGNCELCFPETLNVLRGEAQGKTLRGGMETKLTVSRGAALSALLYLKLKINALLVFNSH